MNGVQSANEGIFGIFGGGMGFFALALAVLIIAALWTIFAKAGKPGWAAIIPFFNYYTLLKVCGKPGWWIILLFIPLVNIIIMLIVTFDLAQVFGHGWGWFFGLLFLPMIFYPMLAWGSSKYLGPEASR